MNLLVFFKMLRTSAVRVSPCFSSNAKPRTPVTTTLSMRLIKIRFTPKSLRRTKQHLPLELILLSQCFKMHTEIPEASRLQIPILDLQQCTVQYGHRPITPDKKLKNPPELYNSPLFKKAIIRRVQLFLLDQNFPISIN